MSVPPALIIHTGDITHLSKPAEFDLAQQLFTRLRTTELHTVPGGHDTTDATVTEYFNRFGQASNNKGYYSFDHGDARDHQRLGRETPERARAQRHGACLATPSKSA